MTSEDVTLKAATAADAPAIRQLAHDSWWTTYGGYLDRGQISLMLELIYSEASLLAQFETGQSFTLAMRGHTPVGFTGFQPKPAEPHTMRIEKLYILPSEQGRGTGKLLINHVAQAALAGGRPQLELNVNRNNPAVTFYQRLGFTVVDTVDTPYHGYVLNDYVMQKDLRSPNAAPLYGI
ncbi:GNAT family N-acetyltransferase [Parapedobacter soli]|uniref:GNAT family N-acetyltransferase n=1 Tax=Parapedobacter soli TaxID=416955 RepID=UPI0021C5F033|nr:GNAT family N-acetyltransferase [Parapedobacter soli]